jgi:hypothetical protein
MRCLFVRVCGAIGTISETSLLARFNLNGGVLLFRQRPLATCNVRAEKGRRALSHFYTASKATGTVPYSHQSPRQENAQDLHQSRHVPMKVASFYQKFCHPRQRRSCSLNIVALLNYYFGLGT